MVTGGNPEEDGQKNNTKGASRSWGTTVSGQSVSTSGSLGSPSSRSEAGMATPASESTCLRLSNLEIQGDDAKSPGAAANKKKKRGQRAAGADKSNRGLRQFSMKVCEKVESKGTTTYNEVADELVTEFADPINSGAPPDQLQYDEKNIRRRVYDALNVLMAMDIISKDKKEIHWKGLPRSSPNDVEELKAQQLALRNRIEKRAAYLRELQEQFIGYQNLIQRNHQLYDFGNAPSGGVALPFILVQTRPNATVEVEISEDMQLVHFDFNSTPFELHDDNYVLKQMNFCGSSSGNAQNLLANGGESSSMSNVNHTHIPLANGGESSSMSNVNRTHVQLANGGEISSMANVNCTPISLANGGESSSMSNLNHIHIPQAWQSSALVRTPSSSTPPGIIKTRVKNEP